MYLSIFRKFIAKFNFYNKLTRIVGTLQEELCTLATYLAEFFLKLGNLIQIL
jgi:hypothetical protein